MARAPKPLLTVPSPRGGTADVEVNDSRWRELLARAYDLDESYVKVGVIESRGGGQRKPSAARRRSIGLVALDEDTAREVEAAGDDGITLAGIAATHEFGIGVPERSFIRGTFLVRRVNALRTMTAKLCREVVTNDMPAERALGLLGQWASKEVKTTITEIDIPPPLAQSTIDAKGSSKPLVDEGRLLNSISYEVVPEDVE